MTSCEEKRRKIENARKRFLEILGRMEEAESRRPAASRAIRQCRIYAKVKKLHLPKKYFAALAVFFSSYLLICAARFLPYNKCLMEYPLSVEKFLRPAEDCSICRQLVEIDKLSNISVQVFEKRFAYSGIPVIITDGASNWTATSEFSFDFFKSLYEGKDGHCQFFPYETEFENLQQVFRMSPERASMKTGTKPWYVGWSNCDEEIGAELRKHYQRPYFLPQTSENERTDWIFMGSPGYGAPMHIDDVWYPSWQAQMRGQKLWILEPPRECFYSCSKLEAVVNPGEINTNRWYHQTRIVSSDVSITIGAEYD